MILNEHITISSKIDDPLYLRLNYNKILEKQNIYFIISSPDLKENVICIRNELSFVLNEDNKFVLNCINTKETKDTDNIKLENSIYDDVKSGEYKSDTINNMLSNLIEHINKLKVKYNENENENESKDDIDETVELESNISLFKDNYSINTDDTLIKNYRIKKKTTDNEIQDFLKILINDNTNIKNNIVNITTELLKFVKTLDINLDEITNIMVSNIIKFLKYNNKYTNDIHTFLNYCIPEIIKLVDNIENKACSSSCKSSCFPCCLL